MNGDGDPKVRVWFERLAFVVVVLALLYDGTESLVREVRLNARGVTTTARTTGYDDNAKLRLVGIAGHVDVVYETPGGPVESSLTAYGFSDVPRPGATIAVEYDRAKPRRVRHAGDHGDAVHGGAAALVLAAIAVAAWRRVAGSRT